MRLFFTIWSIQKAPPFTGSGKALSEISNTKRMLLPVFFIHLRAEYSVDQNLTGGNIAPVVLYRSNFLGVVQWYALILLSLIQQPD